MHPIRTRGRVLVAWLSAAWLGLLSITPLRGQELQDQLEWPLAHEFCSVAFSPDGTILASGNADGVVRLWDPASGQLKAALKGHRTPVSSLAFSPDGKILASAAWDELKFWDTATWKSTRSFNYVKEARPCLAFRADGQVWAASRDHFELNLWDVAQGETPLTLSAPKDPATEELFSFDRVTSMAFSPDGKMLASGDSEKTITLWQSGTGRFIAKWKAHSDRVTSLSFSADGRMLASGSADRTIRLWDVDRRKDRLTIKEAVSDKVLSIAIYSENGKDVEEKMMGEVTALAFSPDRSLLASSSTDPEVNLWDTVSGKKVATLRGHNHNYGVSCLSFSPDARTVASGSGDGACRLWDVATRKNRATLLWNADHGINAFNSQGPVLAMAFSADGRRVAYGATDGLIYLQDPNDSKKTSILRGHTGSIATLSISADGKTLASGSLDMTVRLWDLATGRNTRTIHGLEMVAELSPDAKTLATVAFMGEGLSSDVKLWDATTGKLRATLKGAGAPEQAFSLIFSPNSQVLAVCDSEQRVNLWDVTTAARRATLTGLARMPDLGSNTTLFHFGPVFSPDSKTLAYASDEGMVRLWDVTAARQTATLPMYGSAILTLAFAPDGKTLAGATADKTIVFWDLARNRELTRVGRKEAIVSLSFTVSGKLLASSTRKGVVKVLPIACPKRADQ